MKETISSLHVWSAPPSFFPSSGKFWLLVWRQLLRFFIVYPYTHVPSLVLLHFMKFVSTSAGCKRFAQKKKIIRIISNTRPRDSCRAVFRNMQIMTLYSQYIYSIILFTVNNKQFFIANNEIHKCYTKNNNNVHLASTNLAKYKKGPFISGIKIFNHLPQYLKTLDHNSVHFRSALKRFLYHHSFYSMGEYYEYKENSSW